MTRDYKSSRRPAIKKRRRSHTSGKVGRRKSAHTPGWVWLLCGLGIGLAIAASTYFYLSPQSATLTAETTPVKKIVAKTPASKPKQTEPAVIKKPRFDFYTLLPAMEVVIPDSDIEAANRALPKAEKNLAYMLQTGSFRKAADADTMKAGLALLGIEAKIETAVINNNETWNRVRLGPFPDMQSLRPVRRQLKQNNIEFILLKIRI